MSEPWTRRGFWPWLLGALLLGRLAGLCFGVVNIDEDEFCVIGKMILNGALSYLDIGEFKPPLTHLAFVPAGMFGAVSIWPMRAVGILWLLATCLLLARAAREWTGDELAGRAAAFLALLAAMCEVPATNAELLMDLPLAAALLFFVRAAREGKVRDDLIAGLCIGVASLFKHQGAILLVALALARPRRLVILGAGAAAPWLAASGLWAALGHFDDFFDWMVRRNFFYAQAASLFSWRRAAFSTALCLAGTALPWALAARESIRPDDGVRRGLALSLWLTWIPVAMGGRFYEHYFLQFVPPLAILGAPQAADLIRRWPALSRQLRVGILAALILPVIGYTSYTLARGFTGHYPNQDAKVREVSAWLREHTKAGARLFVWGHAPQIYYLSQRPPGSRYLTATTQMGGFDPGQLPPGFDVGPHRSARDVALLLRDLEANRTDLVVDTAPADMHGWSRVPLDKFPELDRYLRDHYALIGEPAGARVLQRR